jgi:hypothetical protein
LTKRTHRGPAEQGFAPGTSKPDRDPKDVTKSRPVIALDLVPDVFDDARIQKLAIIGKLPRDADLNALAWWTREAAALFTIDARAPTANELHTEIATLCKAAEQQSFERVAVLLDELSAEAGAMLSTLGALPAPRDLKVGSLRQQACEAIVSVCQIGGQLIEGRLRPSGKRSRSQVRQHLYAPARSRHFRKRNAELQFVTRLSIAWWKATGSRPSLNVRHRDASRDIGPFARFVRDCLRLVGAGYADPVELIRQLSSVPSCKAETQFETVKQQPLTDATRHRH